MLKKNYVPKKYFLIFWLMNSIKKKRNEIGISTLNNTKILNATDETILIGNFSFLIDKVFLFNIIKTFLEMFFVGENFYQDYKIVFYKSKMRHFIQIQVL